MASIPATAAIALKSWPPNGTEPPALETLIRRLAVERGGFLNVTEESLKEEIAREAAGAITGQEDGSSDDDDDTRDPDRAGELRKARDDLLLQIESAHQSSMFALDFVSLLLSKDTPVQASLSISPELRNLVGMGTLGADKLQAPRVADAQKQENKIVAKGWKSQNLSSTVDTILASAARLEKEIDLETRYWEQVLAVSDNGWAVCRLPNERQTLGVRFGFSEASPSFRNRGLGALRRHADGSISLDQGASGSRPQAIRVRIQVNGQDTGSSPIPKPAPDGAPIESLIMQARNTIFTAELWQELNREARLLGSLNVRAKGDTVTFPISAEKTVILDVVSLNDVVTAGPNSDDDIAKGLYLSLNLLLSFSHRQTHRRRTFPPPPISGIKRPLLPYNLLRPLLTQINHQLTLKSLRKMMVPLIAVVSQTGLKPKPRFGLQFSDVAHASILPTPEQTIVSLTDRLESTLSYSPTGNTTITLAVRTQMNPVPTTIFIPTLSPASPLLTNCPPPPSFTTFAALQQYLYFATCCAIASLFTILPDSTLDTSSTTKSEPEESTWQMSPQPNTLHRNFPNGVQKSLTFSIHPVPSPFDSPTSHVLASSRNGIKIRLTTSPSSASKKLLFEKSQSESSRNNGKAGGKEDEGIYEWVAWDDGGQGAWEDGEGEVIRDISKLVEEAGTK